MRFEWNQQKARANLRKHGIDFSDVEAVLEDVKAVTLATNRASENRFVAIGKDRMGQVLVVVYAKRSERIRLISARRASRRERRRYEG